MKIVCDNKIPYIRETLEKLADEVVYLPGAEIRNEDVKDADALMVRTRTKCNAQLLEGTNVRFVATATIGFDHIDTDYMKQSGIYWTNCPGCNAASVEQYVRESLKCLLADGRISAKEGDNRLAVIGHGHVGSRIARMAKELGFCVYVYDPFLFPENGFDEVYDCNIITFHTPLTRNGEYPTFHMADADFFARLKRKPVIINSSRGEVVDNKALVEAKDNGLVSELIIDVWENEPNISLELMNRCYIATPHIAGYSANGKVNADNMVVEAFCKFFGKPLPEKILPPAVDYAGYNPKEDHERLTKSPELFEKLRGDYPIRLETSF